jgi:hypothetical protein
VKKHTAPIIAAFLLLLPVLYVGSYLALVVPNGRIVFPKQGLIYRSNYRADGFWSADFFWPLEQIDRRGRPSEWDTDVPSP